MITGIVISRIIKNDKLFELKFQINEDNNIRKVKYFNFIAIATLLTYPFVFSAQRGSASIFSALMVALAALFLKEKNYKKMTIFLSIAATAQIQLIPLILVLFIPKIFKYGKFGIAYISLSYFFIFISAGYENLMATYKLNKSLFINVTDYSHDLLSLITSLDYLNTKLSFIIGLIYLALAFCIFYIIRYIYKQKNDISILLKSKDYDFTQDIASKVFFIGIAISLLFANPSFDYHLVKLIPAFALMISLNKIKMSPISIASFALTISYLRLWDFLYTKDMAVPIRALSISLITIEVTLTLFSIVRKKYLIENGSLKQVFS